MTTSRYTDISVAASDGPPATDLSLDESANVLCAAAPRALDAALGGGGHYADLFAEDTFRSALALKGAGTRPPERHVEKARLAGMALRVKDGRCPRLEHAATLDAAVLTGLAAAVSAGDPRSHHAVSPSSMPAAPAHLPDAPDQAGDAEKLALLAAAYDAAMSLDARIRRLEVAYRDERRRVLIVGSDGRAVRDDRAHVSLRVRVALTTAAGTVRGQAVGGSGGGIGYFLNVRPEDIARAAVLQAHANEGARPLASGRLPVVFAAGFPAGTWLHEAVGHLLEADVHVSRSGNGLLSGPVFVTIVDDPTCVGGRGTAQVDDEGTPAAPRVLVSSGACVGLLGDGAVADGAAPSGSARCATYRDVPLPRMSNLCLQPGTHAPGALIEGADGGIFVEDLGQGMVLAEDDTYRFYVRSGRRIVAGTLAEAVGNVWLEGRVSEALPSLVGVGTDFSIDTARGACSKRGQVIPVSVAAPTVLVEGLNVV